MSILNKYSWDEIVERTAERIDRPEHGKFKEWMQQKEYIKYPFSAPLFGRAYQVYKDLNEEQNHVTVICGKVGTGKSTVGLNFCSLISPGITMKNVVFNAVDFLKAVKDSQPGDSILGDEAVMLLHSRRAMQRTNIDIIELFNVFRQKHLHVCMCIPKYKTMDSAIREEFVDTLIYVYRINNKWCYKLIWGKGIDVINEVIYVKKIDEIKLPNGTFIDGYFNKGIPTINDINVESYLKKKQEFIDSRLDESIDKLSKPAEKEFISVAEAQSMISLSRDVIVKHIKNDVIKGRLIGGKWFVERKYLTNLGGMPSL